MLVVVFHSFCCCSSFCCSSFISRLLCHATGTPPWLLRPLKTSISSELYPGYLWLPLLFHLPRALRFWADISYPQGFFIIHSFPDIFDSTYVYQGSEGAGSSSLKFAGLYADTGNTDLAHLFFWFPAIHILHIQKNSFLNSTKYYHKLLKGKSLVYLLLFELFLLVQSICKDY